MKKVAAIAATSLTAGAVLILGVPSAWPTTKGPQSTDVSCDSTTVKVGVSVTMGSNGTYKITYNSDSGGVGNNDTWWTARSANGNDLPAKASVPGEVRIWNPVIKSTYTTRIVRRYESNCNGILPGHGNYSVNYTVNYPG